MLLKSIRSFECGRPITIVIEFSVKFGGCLGLHHDSSFSLFPLTGAKQQLIYKGKPITIQLDLKVLIMETLQAIKTRRSIRKFLNKPVPDEVIETLLEAAMFAPSAGNEQPWQFVVLNDRKLLNDIPRFCATASMCRQSAAAILVCGDDSLKKYPEFWVQDCSAAVENILLAAHDLGLGAVWAGIYPLKDRISAFQKHLSLPDEITPFALIALGFPAETPEEPQRYRRERVHYNGW